jgi:hypothetical protein
MRPATNKIMVNMIVRFKLYKTVSDGDNCQKGAFLDGL